MLKKNVGVQPSLAKSVFTRPKTAGVETRDVGTLTATACELGKREGASKPDSEQNVCQKTERNLWCFLAGEDSVKVVDLDSEHHTAADVGSEYVERLKESMAQNYHWTTATQRSDTHTHTQARMHTHTHTPQSLQSSCTYKGPITK